ncbi:MAG: G1 family glutamic endopeptidase, partial [Bacilli bacterium]
MSNYMPAGLIVHIPPVGFDPMTASNSDLAKYGLPPRPTDQTKLAQWEKDYGTVKHWIDPTFTHLNQKLDTLSPNGGGWSGLTYDNSSQPASRVVGWWVQPLSSAPSQDQPAYSASWIGLGGVNGNPLIQGGTESNVGTNNNYPAIWEIAGTNKATGGVLTVNGLNNVASDYMYCDISYANGTANFYFHDLTNGNAVSFSQTGITGFSTNGEADWITEDPSLGTGLALTMADYGSVTFTAESGTPSGVNYPPANSSYDTYWYAQPNG